MFTHSTAVALAIDGDAFPASIEDLASVPMPGPTRTFVPVPHHRLAAVVKEKAAGMGFVLISEGYALAEKGQVMFGVLSINQEVVPGANLAIGMRSSYNKRFRASIGAGTRVAACSSLAFSAELQLERKHTTRIEADLPVLVTAALLGALKQVEPMRLAIAAMRSRSLTDEAACSAIIDATRKELVVSSLVRRVADLWYSTHPSIGSNLWGLERAFTRAGAERARVVGFGPMYRLAYGVRPFLLRRFGLNA